MTGPFTYCGTTGWDPTAVVTLMITSTSMLFCFHAIGSIGSSMVSRIPIRRARLRIEPPGQDIQALKPGDQGFKGRLTTTCGALLYIWVNDVPENHPGANRLGTFQSVNKVTAGLR